MTKNQLLTKVKEIPQEYTNYKWCNKKHRNKIYILLLSRTNLLRCILIEFNRNGQKNVILLHNSWIAHFHVNGEQLICLTNRSMNRWCFCAKKIWTVEKRDSNHTVFSCLSLSMTTLCFSAWVQSVLLPFGVFKGRWVIGSFCFGQNGQYILLTPSMQNLTHTFLLQHHVFLYEHLYCEKPTRLPNIYWMICAWYC